MAEKTKAVAKTVSDATRLALAESFPVEDGFTRTRFPRLGLVSQDIIEETINPKTKKKEIKVITEAGTFFTDVATDKEEDVFDDNGKKTGTKKVWQRDELGTEIEGIILFRRKQLRMYDESTETFTSSPVYDNDDEIIPLFCNKAEVERGTPAELKAKYQFTDDAGKVKTKLEENRILYVIFKDEVYEMSLRGTSMYAFMTYARKVTPPAVLTKFSSEAKEKGKIKWNQMSFVADRDLSESEAQDVLARVNEIKAKLEAEKGGYAAKLSTTEFTEKEKKELGQV